MGEIALAMLKCWQRMNIIDLNRMGPLLAEELEEHANFLITWEELSQFKELLTKEGILRLTSYREITTEVTLFSSDEQKEFNKGLEACTTVEEKDAFRKGFYEKVKNKRDEKKKEVEKTALKRDKRIKEQIGG